MLDYNKTESNPGKWTTDDQITQNKLLSKQTLKTQTQKY